MKEEAEGANEEEEEEEEEEELLQDLPGRGKQPEPIMAIGW